MAAGESGAREPLRTRGIARRRPGVRATDATESEYGAVLRQRFDVADAQSASRTSGTVTDSERAADALPDAADAVEWREFATGAHAACGAGRHESCAETV